MTDPVFPNWPPRPDHVCYEYLASVGITGSRLDRCCVKEVEVVGVTDRQKVTVRYNDTDYPDIPVFVHTDIGARRALVLGEQYEDASEYFKDAALMFPFPGGSGYYTPMVLAVVYSNPETHTEEVLCVYNVVQTVNKNFESNKPPMTYRVYVKYRISHKGGAPDAPMIAYPDYNLYDLINDDFAVIPTRLDGYEGDPSLPMITAKGLSDPTQIDLFCGRGIRLAFETEFGAGMPEWNAVSSYQNRGCHSLYPGTLSGVYGACTCEGGTVADPGWTRSGSAGNYTYSSACFGGTGVSVDSGGASYFTETNPVVSTTDISYGVSDDLVTSSPANHAGTVTYSNGLVIDYFTSGYSHLDFKTPSNNAEIYDETTTVTFDGVEKTRNIRFETSGYPFWQKKVVSIKLPRCLPNFLCDLWEWGTIDIWRRSVGGGAYEYQFSDYSEMGWTTPTFLVQSTNMFNAIRDRLVELFEGGVFPWYNGSPYVVSVDFLGFYFVPYDVRVDKLLAG